MWYINGYILCMGDIPGRHFSRGIAAWTSGSVLNSQGIIPQVKCLLPYIIGPSTYPLSSMLKAETPKRAPTMASLGPRMGPCGDGQFCHLLFHNLRLTFHEFWYIPFHFWCPTNTFYTWEWVIEGWFCQVHTAVGWLSNALRARIGLLPWPILWGPFLAVGLE